MARRRSGNLAAPSLDQTGDQGLEESLIDAQHILEAGRRHISAITLR
jgi:hypothetical protein